MAPPELVITNAASKSWPGGLWSFRATSWMAHGSSEASSQAIEGTVIRDTQHAGTTLETATKRSNAFVAASDTVTLSLSGLGVETKYYNIFVSALIEGDWDPAVANSRQKSYPMFFQYPAMLGIYGDANHAFNTQYIEPKMYPRKTGHYMMLRFNDNFNIATGSEVLHIRALADQTSTIQWLIDQIVLVPDYTSSFGSTYIGGGVGARDSWNSTPIVDGADGGDVNGQYTWHPNTLSIEPTTDPRIEDPEAGIFGAPGDGGGDYQKADNEYLFDIVPNDYWDLTADATAPPTEVYSLHGAYYRPYEQIEFDQFTRSASGSWGTASPKGYRWGAQSSNNSTPSVTGTEGQCHFTGLVPRDTGSFRASLDGDNFSDGAYLRCENMAFSGKWRVQSTGTSLPMWDGSTVEVVVIIAGMGSAFPGSPETGVALLFDVINARWKLIKCDALSAPYPSTTLSSFTSAGDVTSWQSASWFALGSMVGFRVEVKRHLLRARVWDATGSEPSTWNYSAFRPLTGIFGLNQRTWTDYPYASPWHLQDAGSSDSWVIPRRMNSPWSPIIWVSGTGYVRQWDFFCDDLKWETDPYGSLAQTHASLEHPKGTELARIAIPSGAWHFVYWGKRQLTVHNGPYDDPIVMATKVWSDSGAAELQRAENPFWWFKSAPIPPLKIIPMNFQPIEEFYSE